MTQRPLWGYTPAPRDATSTQQVTPKDKERFKSVDQIVLGILADNVAHTNHELAAATNGARINSSISRLRKRDGHRIEAKKIGRDGTFTYRLLDVLSEKERDAL